MLLAPKMLVFGVFNDLYECVVPMHTVYTNVVLAQDFLNALEETCKDMPLETGHKMDFCLKDEVKYVEGYFMAESA